MTSELEMCTFHVDKHFCAIRAQDVQEVVEFQEITRVPLAPPEVRGLINLRGQILTVIDLRRLLEIEGATACHERPISIVVRNGDDCLSLLVDRIDEVITVTEGSFETPPETLTGRVRDYIIGAYKLDPELLLMLDVMQIINMKLAT